MTPEAYLDAVRRTASVALGDRLPAQRARVAAGLAGESGEIVDCLKKWAHHGAATGPEVLATEMGDLWWYIGLAHLVEGWNFRATLVIQEGPRGGGVQEGHDPLRLALQVFLTTAVCVDRVLTWRDTVRVPQAPFPFRRLAAELAALERLAVPGLDVWAMNDAKLRARWPEGFVLGVGQRRTEE